ncbi:MAG: transporter [Planctomyces sp.]|nr:transporter [Planctomyces sp.]
MHTSRSTSARPFRNQSHLRRGALSVEMSLTIPVLFAIFFGSVEITRLNMLRHTIENAAYEGARQGIVPGATADSARAAALAALAAIDVRDAVVTVDPPVILASTPRVTVEIQVPVARNSWGTSSFVGLTELERSCTLSRESLSF